jgi:hypothetical protein
MIHNLSTDVCMRNIGKRWNGERRPVLIHVPGSHKRLALRKCIMCASTMGVHVQRGTRRTKGMRKRDEKSDSCAAKKGAKKLVNSNCAKILVKESSD